MAKATTYKCKQCGTRLVVTEALESRLSPIYCCGAEVKKLSSGAKLKKKVAKKKTAKKKISAKKKTQKK